MSIHVTTGNRLDVVYDYENGRKVLKGLYRHSDRSLIPLPDPQGMVSVLLTVLNEIAVQEINDGKANNEARSNP
jgi:hypothetical protein